MIARPRRGACRRDQIQLRPSRVNFEANVASLAMQVHNRGSECIGMHLLLSAVGDGQEAGPVGVRAERARAKAADTAAQYRGRRVTKSPRRTRAIRFTITRDFMDPASRHDNHGDTEYAQREHLNARRLHGKYKRLANVVPK